LVILAHKITCIKLVSLLVGPNLIVLTLTDGKVLEWFKSLERGVWGLVLKCYELRTRQHRNIKCYCPSSFETLFPLGYNDLHKKVMKDIPSLSQHMSIKVETYEI
jgi:hypothetical protein